MIATTLTLFGFQSPNAKRVKAAPQVKEPATPAAAPTCPQSVNVLSAPPILTKSTKDIWDEALVVATVLLVFVGGFQILFLWRTVQATNRNAEAALTTATAMMNAERAWVDAQLEDDGYGHHKLTITNHGRTPAEIASFEVSDGILTVGTRFDPQNLSNKFSRNLNILLGSGGSGTLDEVVDMAEIFKNRSGEMIVKSTLGAYCLTVKYTDVITRGVEPREIHETSFVYTYAPLTMSLERVSIYNRLT